MTGRNDRDLHAWQKAMDLVEVVYRLTESSRPNYLRNDAVQPFIDRCSEVGDWSQA